jgi:hypothetical protein
MVILSHVCGVAMIIFWIGIVGNDVSGKDKKFLNKLGWPKIFSSTINQTKNFGLTGKNTQKQN